MNKYTITKVFVATTNKDGIAYKYSKGKYEGQPFTRVSIKVEGDEENYYSANVSPTHKATTLKEGDKEFMILTEDNGFKNFRFPNKDEMADYLKNL